MNTGNTEREQSSAADPQGRNEALVSDLPVKVVYGDGVRDDTEALQAYIDGTARVMYHDGRPFAMGIAGTFKITKPLQYR